MSPDHPPASDQPSAPGRVFGSEPDDTTVVRDVRSGKTDAYEVLVRRYQRPVYRALYRMVGDVEDARDLTQTAFVKAFEHLGSFDDRQRFFSWLYRIAVHEGLNHLRRSGRVEPLDEPAAAPGPGPDGAAEARRREAALQEAIMTLTPEHRAVVVLRHFLDCSYREIADAVGAPEKTVKSRLFEARRALRVRLESKGVLR